LFALSTASALGELVGYYNIATKVADFFLVLPASTSMFMLIVIIFFLFMGTFMDAVPAMILFVPVILPVSHALGIHPLHIGIVIVMTLALGLITPPYGLCLLIAGSIAHLPVEKSFKGVLLFLLVAILVLLIVAFFPSLILDVPKFINPSLF